MRIVLETISAQIGWDNIFFEKSFLKELGLFSGLQITDLGLTLKR